MRSTEPQPARNPDHTLLHRRISALLRSSSSSSRLDLSHSPSLHHRPRRRSRPPPPRPPLPLPLLLPQLAQRQLHHPPPLRRPPVPRGPSSPPPVHRLRLPPRRAHVQCPHRAGSGREAAGFYFQGCSGFGIWQSRLGSFVGELQSIDAPVLLHWPEAPAGARLVFRHGR
uniref:Uncharacterized protein n=1 Tax=Kalanchoe fedtschenkoi TaxID=63787 RepID=A0A7N0VGI6_KALFE